MKALIIRIIICLIVFGFCLYSYIDKQNELTGLKIELPQLVKEIKGLNEEIQKMRYEIDQFESPAHLMQLVKYPEYSHLKHPFIEDVLTMPEGIAFKVKDRENIY